MDTRLSFDAAQIKRLITHRIGNKSKVEPLVISEVETQVSQVETQAFLHQYFLSAFKPIDFYHFHHHVDLDLNEIFSISSKIFDNQDEFLASSKDIAQLLFDYSDHPKIKSGELNVVYFDQIELDDLVVDAIGIFKSESNLPFLKMKGNGRYYDIDHEYGFDLKGIDKACIIFNTDKEDGYALLVKDNTSKGSDAQFWVDQFLKLKPIGDDFYQTKEFLTITKDFVTGEMDNTTNISRTDGIDMLNRTMDYFKINDHFDKKHFEDEVLQDEKVIDSFRAYEQPFRDNLNLESSFDISSPAVKKQARVYKSVLKLDKNFHVYIHGDKSLIERGMEEDGRKFYKIYFESEA